MSSIILEAVWVGTFSSSLERDEQLLAIHAVIKAQHDFPEFVSDVSQGSNGLIQFMIMPAGSKVGWATQNSWEDMIKHAAMLCAGTRFSVKRVYITEI